MCCKRSLHYHRIHPEQWEDRMLRVRALGLNTISVCTPSSLSNQYCRLSSAACIRSRGARL